MTAVVDRHLHIQHHKRNNNLDRLYRPGLFLQEQKKPACPSEPEPTPTRLFVIVGADCSTVRSCLNVLDI